MAQHVGDNVDGELGIFRQVCAFMAPPLRSISAEIAKAERSRVPLNIICSTRCATPFADHGSLRVPTPTQAPITVLSASRMVSVAMRRPLGRVVIWMVVMRPL
jgi:hypothetical protein